MKQVIFICLLSVSMCLGDTTAAVENTSVPLQTAIHEEAGITNNTKPISNPLLVDQVNKTLPFNNTVPKNDTTAPSPTKDTTQAPQNQTDKSTPPITVVPSSKSSAPTTQGNTTVTNSTVPPDNKPVPTAAPKIVPTPSVPAVQARGFDGASFVGGIILTLGLLAISFMGFKYYKNQTERNYHTL